MNTTIIPDRELDIRAELCPMTFVRTRLALDQMTPGQVLRVRLRGAEPLENVPRAAREQGHEILALEQDEEGGAILLLRVGETARRGSRTPTPTGRGF